MKTRALISFAVTAKLIIVFVFAYAKRQFSHDEAQIIMSGCKDLDFAPNKDSDQPWHAPSLISLHCPHDESKGYPMNDNENFTRNILTSEPFKYTEGNKFSNL